MSFATKESREIGQHLERELKLKDFILMVGEMVACLCTNGMSQ